MNAIHTLPAGLLVALTLALPAAAQQSDLTYQGRLLQSGAPADGTFNAAFTLWDAETGGSQVGPTNTRNGLAVSGGLLVADLDFGADAFNAERWLEISIDGNTLSPRQRLSAAPKAARLEGVNNAPNGRFGINSTNPVAKWHVEQDDGVAIYGQSLLDDAIVGVAARDAKHAVWGINSAGDGIGVQGQIDSSPGAGVGVLGRSFADQGAGVLGEATNSAGAGVGVVGRTVGSQDYAVGVYGVAEAATGTVYAGRFECESAGNGASGLLVRSNATSGNTYGMFASEYSPDGTAVGAYVNAASRGYAVKGVNTNPDGYAGYFVGRGYFRDHTAVGRFDVKTSGAEWFGVHTTAEAGQYGGMYVSGQNGAALPFYGYSADGDTPDAWTFYDGGARTWNLYASGTRITANKDTGYVGIGDSTPDYPLDMASGAHCTVGGVWTNASSREWKRDFKPVNTRDILDRVATLPITEWSYKTEDGVRHLGPVAEDFAEAFNLGDDHQTIATADADGVALAAIQALNQIVREKDAQIADLRERLEELEAIVEAMQD